MVRDIPEARPRMVLKTAEGIFSTAVVPWVDYILYLVVQKHRCVVVETYFTHFQPWWYNSLILWASLFG